MKWGKGSVLSCFIKDIDYNGVSKRKGKRKKKKKGKKKFRTPPLKRKEKKKIQNTSNVV